MNRLEYYDGLRKYEMKHSSIKDREWEDHKYTDKIDLGNGQFRYIYDNGSAKTQAAREAAQRNQYQRQQQNLKTAQNTAKKLEAERQQASKTSSQIYSERRDRVEKTNQEIQNLFNAGSSGVYDKVENIIKETPEYKSALSFLKNRFSQCKNTEELRNTVFDGETEDYAKAWGYTYNNVPSWFGKIISSDLVHDAYQDKYQELKRKEMAAETINSREEEIKKSVEIFRENDKNPVAMQYRLDKTMDDYLDDYLSPYIVHYNMATGENFDSWENAPEDARKRLEEEYLAGKKFASLKNIQECDATLAYAKMSSELSIMRANEEKDPENGLPIKASPMSIEDDLKYINYGRQTGFDSLSGGGNCRLCTLALDLRQRGYDVSAPSFDEARENADFFYMPEKILNIKLPFIDEPINLIENPLNGIKKMYTDYDKAERYTFGDMDDLDELRNTMSQSPNTYGNFNIHWDSGLFKGHSMFYKVDGDGNVLVYDGQTNMSYSLENVCKLGYNYEFTRTDNLTPDYEFIKENGWVVYE